MKRRFAVNKRSGKTNLVFVGSFTGLVVIMLTVLVSHYLANQSAHWEAKNIEISVYDHSVADEDPSCKVVIDGNTVYQIDSISDSFFYNIALDNGKHIIEISTIEGDYKVTDSILVVNYPEVWSLVITYDYNPPVDEYKKVMIERQYKLLTEGIKFSDVQKSDILYWIKREVNNDPYFLTWYKPGSRHFAFEFRLEKDNYIMID